MVACAGDGVFVAGSHHASAYSSKAKSCDDVTAKIHHSVMRLPVRFSSHRHVFSVVDLNEVMSSTDGTSGFRLAGEWSQAKKHFSSFGEWPGGEILIGELFEIAGH